MSEARIDPLEWYCGADETGCHAAQFIIFHARIAAGSDKKSAKPGYFCQFSGKMNARHPKNSVFLFDRF
jgi:hypothetical protein